MLGSFRPYDLCMNRFILHSTHSQSAFKPSAVWDQEFSGSAGLCHLSSSIRAFSLPSYPSSNLESLEAIQMFSSTGDILLFLPQSKSYFCFSWIMTNEVRHANASMWWTHLSITQIFLNLMVAIITNFDEEGIHISHYKNDLLVGYSSPQNER